MKNFKFGVAEWCLPCSGANAVYLASSWGAANIHIEVPRSYSDQFAWEKKVSVAGQETAVKITAVAGNAVEDDFPLTASVGTLKYKQTVGYIKRTIDGASAVGAESVCFPSFGASAITDYCMMEATASLLYLACEYAHDRLLVATENVLAPNDCRKLLELVGAHNAVVIFDSLNLVSERLCSADILRSLADLILPEVHIKDGPIGSQLGNVLLGTGAGGFNQELANVLSVLKLSRYILENDYHLRGQAGWLQDTQRILMALHRVEIQKNIEGVL